MRELKWAEGSSRGAALRSGSVESAGCICAIPFVLLKGNNPEMQLRWQGFTNQSTPEGEQQLLVRANSPGRAHGDGL